MIWPFTSRKQRALDIALATIENSKGAKDASLRKSHRESEESERAAHRVVDLLTLKNGNGHA